MSILDLTALELGKKIKAGEITSPQATEAVIKQIKAVEEQVHSYVTLDEEGAMKRAKEVQAQIEAGTRQVHWQVYRLLLRITCVLKTCALPAAQRSLKILCQLIQQRLF